MERIGEMIRRLRKEKGEPLRVLAAYLQVDQAIMSKIETGQRRPNKEQVEKLAEYFDADKGEMRIALLSDRIADELRGEDLAVEALKVAEEKVAYLSRTAIDRKSIIAKIKNFLDDDGRIKKAWIFGSFARGDDGLDSDLDILVEEDKNLKFSYFDLADVQFRLEKLIQKKVDLGFSDSAKANAAPQIMNEAVLIYAKP